MSFFQKERLSVEPYETPTVELSRNTAASPAPEPRIPAVNQKPGVKWIMRPCGLETVQYICGSTVTFGTEETDGPSILLQRNYYIYLSIHFDAKQDAYYVMWDFDGPFLRYSRGESFTYGFDTFVLL